MSPASLQMAIILVQLSQSFSAVTLLLYVSNLVILCVISFTN